MRQKVPSILTNGLLNVIRTVMSILFPLITYPYATRILQAENLGKVNFASTYIGYFSLIAVLGLTGYAGREGVQYRNDKKKLNIFCNDLLTLNLCTTVFSYIMLIVTMLLWPKLQDYSILIVIYSTTILFSTLGMEWLYVLEEDYAYITIRSILFQIISLVLMFVLVKDRHDYYMYATINVLASVGGNIFNFLHARKYIRPRLVFRRRIFTHLKYSIVFFSSSIASSIYSNIDTTMLGIMCSDYHVGIYSVAVKMYTMIKSVLTAITSVTMPRLTYYRSQNMEKEFNLLISKLFKTMITFLLPVVVGLNMVAEEVIVLFCGDGFDEAKTALSILSFAILFSIFATVTNGCVLIPSKQEKRVLTTTVSAAVVNFITNLVAVPIFKQNGAAFTTALAECVVLMISWHYAKRMVVLENMKKTVLSGILGCVVMVLFGYGMELLITDLIMSLVIKVLGGIFVYLLVCFLSKNEILLTYTAMMRDKLKCHY